MVKVPRPKANHRMEALRLANAFARPRSDASTESFVFEITGATPIIESFVPADDPAGLVRVSRTGNGRDRRVRRAMVNANPPRHNLSRRF